MTWTVEALSTAHVRTDFSCGHAQLDDYLKKQAGQRARKDIGRTFVALRPDQPHVLGYYTLSASSVEFAHVPEALQRKLPRYPLPVALIGKLAVDLTTQGQGLGEFLLMDALRRIVDIAEQMAVLAVEVHALDEPAKKFYLKFGFQPFLDQPLHSLLPVATIRPLFGA
jgi:GNAT superfamily N-acetyltransferase